MRHDSDLKKLLANSSKLAVKVNDDKVRFEHVVRAIFLFDNPYHDRIKRELDDDYDNFIEDLDNMIRNISSNLNIDSGKAVKVDSEIFKINSELTNDKSIQIVTIKDYLLKILNYDKDLNIKSLLIDYGLDEDFFNDVSSDVNTTTDEEDLVEEVVAKHDEIPDKTPNVHRTKPTKSKTPVLDEHSRDLSSLAQDGKLDPVIGRDHEIKRVIQILARRKKNNPILLGDAGVGKCLARGTKVLMYDGSFKAVEDVVVGDQLMGIDSTPRTVLSLGNGYDDMYRVAQKNGNDYVVNSEHILSLKASGHKKIKTGEIINIPITEYLSLSKLEQTSLKGWKTGVEYDSNYTPLPAYYVGLWLGDGSLHKNDVTNIDPEIIEYLTDLAHYYGLSLNKNEITYHMTRSRGYTINQIDANTGEFIKKWNSISEFAKENNVSGKCISDYFNGKQKTAYGYKWELIGFVNPINDILNELGLLNEKFIPKAYLINDKKTRLELLAGLIDSDGYLTKSNCYEITQKSERLFNDIVTLSRSLGYRVNVNKPKIINNVVYHRMIISANDFSELPVKLPRKKVTNKSNRVDKLVGGISIEYVGYDEYFGFNIDGDHLFILDDFTVTHNTAIAEGIAIKISERDCPKILRNKRIVALDLTSMVAGTKYRGQFEERIKAVMNEVVKDKDTILFLDEIHTVVGAGSAAGSMDAANIIKPSLARGEFQCIGATTIEEYRNTIEKDGALDRRFQSVMVNEPTPEQTLEILKQLKPYYESHHNVRYTDEALSEIVRVSGRYISNRFFPDKAIDVLDEAGSKRQVELKTPDFIVELENEKARIIEEKNKSVKAQKYEHAGTLRAKETEIIAKIEKAEAEWTEQISNDSPVIDIAEINETISLMTGIPVSRLSQNELKNMMTSDQEIRNRVIGQDKAMNIVIDSVKRNRIGIGRKNKPIGTFMFIGATGVGKTELSKQVAKWIFGNGGDGDNMVRIDMNEYNQDISINRLIGAPAGYIGYGESNELTDKVRRNPYTLVLFDEIEKAHPKVHQVLMRLLDEGELKDTQGRVVSFKNTIIVMTSNVGVKDALNNKSVGYSSSTADENKDFEAKIRKSLKKAFAPEFINRIDEIVYFNQLTTDDILAITRLNVNDFISRCAEEKYDVKVTDLAIKRISEIAYKPEYNAREVNRVIVRELENPLMDAIVKSGLVDGGKFTIGYSETTGKFTVKKL